MREQNVFHAPQARRDAATSETLSTPTPADSVQEQMVRKEQVLERGMLGKPAGLPLNVEGSTGGTG